MVYLNTIGLAYGRASLYIVYMGNDDIRYMTHEQRIAEGYMEAPEINRAVPVITTCRCGKTVTHEHGHVVRLDGNPVTCPRNCEG